MSESPAWYIADGHQQHGPYTTEQVESMIQTRPMGDTHVGALGEEGWVRLDRHPVFAALVSSTASSQARGGQRSKSTSSMPLAIVVVAFLGLVGVAVALASGWESRMAGFVPEDVSLYVEVQDLSSLSKALAGAGFVDEGRLDVEGLKEEVSDALRDSFDIDDEVAKEVVEDLRGVAFAMRRSSSNDEELALLLDFSSSDAVEALLESKRFDADGELGDGVLAYGVEGHTPRPFEPRPFRTELRSGLSSISIGSAHRDTTLAWFEEHDLMVLGSNELLEDMVEVVDGDEPSLLESEYWGQSSVDDEVEIFAFVSPERLDEDSRSEIEDDLGLDELGSIVSSTRFLELGAATKIQAVARRRRELPLEPVTLDLSDRLPRSTLAYATYHPSVGLTDEVVVEQLVDALPQGTRALADPSTVRMLVPTLGMMDGERLFVLLGSDDLRIEAGSTAIDVLPHMAVALVAHVDGDRLESWMNEPTAQLASGLLKEGRSWGLETSVGQGDIEVKHPRFPGVSVRAAVLEDDTLVVAIGGDRMIEEVIGALHGEVETLGDDGDHEAFIETVSDDERVRVWANVRRMERATPKIPHPLSDLDLAEELGLSPRAIVLDGDEPLMLGLAVSVESDGEELRVEARDLNIGASPAPYIVAHFVGRLSGALTREPEPLGVGARSLGRSNPWF